MPRWLRSRWEPLRNVLLTWSSAQLEEYCRTAGLVGFEGSFANVCFNNNNKTNNDNLSQMFVELRMTHEPSEEPLKCLSQVQYYQSISL